MTLKPYKVKSLTLALVVALVATLAGCSYGDTYVPRTSSDGQNAQTAISFLENIPGIEEVQYEAVLEERKAQGVPFAWVDESMNPTLYVKIADGYAVQDREQFILYLTQTLWSINDNSPFGMMRLYIDGGVEPTYVWNHEVDNIFGKGSYLPYFSYSYKITKFGDEATHRIVLEDNLYEDKFGRWAGKVPTWNSELLIEGDIVNQKTDAIYGVRFSANGLTPAYSDISYVCITIAGQKAPTPTGEYYNGLISFKIVGPNNFILEESFPTTDVENSFYSGNDNFCYPEGQLKSGEYIATVTVEQNEQFRNIEEIVLEERLN